MAVNLRCGDSLYFIGQWQIQDGYQPDGQGHWFHSHFFNIVAFTVQSKNKNVATIMLIFTTAISKKAPPQTPAGELITLPGPVDTGTL